MYCLMLSVGCVVYCCWCRVRVRLFVRSCYVVFSVLWVCWILFGIGSMWVWVIGIVVMIFYV